MKSSPRLEKITPAYGSSIHIKQYSDACRNKTPFWHIHPEIELVYVNGGSGTRHIGNQLSYYENGDLILLGANLPHTGFTDRLTGNRSETVVQLPPEFLGEQFLELPELVEIKRLLERAKRGVVFHGKTKRKVGQRMEKLINYGPFDRMLKLLIILKLLANSSEAEVLNVDSFALEIEIQDNDRINKVYDFVRSNFMQTIPLGVISEEIHMTVPSFCRYFKKMSGKTFTRFVNEYRIVHAIKLLSEQKASIKDICFASGFSNFSHFNKQFKGFTGKSPSAYRKEITRVLQ
jgi:AraC-like DNA-binding protein